MLVKINFKNGNRTVFNADCYDPNDLRRDLVQQNANGSHFKGRSLLNEKNSKNFI